MNAHAHREELHRGPRSEWRQHPQGPEAGYGIDESEYTGDHRRRCSPRSTRRARAHYLEDLRGAATSWPRSCSRRPWTARSRACHGRLPVVRKGDCSHPEGRQRPRRRGADGVQVMKPMPDLDALLERAVAKGIFGTKMRSVIKVANPEGIKASVIAAAQVSASRSSPRG